MSIPERVLKTAPRPAYGFQRTAPRRVNPFDLDATLPLRPEAQAPAEVLDMKCLHCQAPVLRGTAPVEAARHGFHLSWQALPAWVCSRCGQTYFEAREVDLVRSTLKNMSRLGA